MWIPSSPKTPAASSAGRERFPSVLTRHVAERSAMQSRPRDASPLRTLTAAKESLAAAKRAKEEAEKRIADSETEVAAAQRAVEAAKYSALIAVKPRALWKAYALWLFTPLVWPGAYLFYLGRDTHAWLHTCLLYTSPSPRD